MLEVKFIYLTSDYIRVSPIIMGDSGMPAGLIIAKILIFEDMGDIDLSSYWLSR